MCSCVLLKAVQGPPGRPPSGAPGAKDQFAASRKKGCSFGIGIQWLVWGFFYTVLGFFLHHFGVKKTPKAAQEKTTTGKAQHAQTFLKELHCSGKEGVFSTPL